MADVTRQWKLDKTSTATIVLPDPRTLTPAHIERLRRYVAALEVEAAIWWTDDEAPDARRKGPR